MQNHGFVRCMIAKNNNSFYNPKQATEQIKRQITRAETWKTKILVFPELCLSGCSCKDLFYSPELLNDIIFNILAITNHSKDSDCLIVVGAPLKKDGNLYNCAVVIHHGKILGVVPKQNLSEDEKRWFTPYISSEPTTISLKRDFIDYYNIDSYCIPFGNLIFSSSLGYKLGIEIGEDLYSVIPPSSYLALAGANIIANPAASYELVGKDDYRQELIKNQSSRALCAYLYTSAGVEESSGEVVYGGSGYIFENGKKLREFQRFTSNLEEVFDDIDIENLENKRLTNEIFKNNKNTTTIPFKGIYFSQSSECNFLREINPAPFIPDEAIADKVYAEIFNIQATGLARRLSAINCSRVTLGVSGGLDSTLALLVCCEAFNKLSYKYDGPNSKIIGITMPGFGTTNRTYNNAVELCKELNIPLTEISVKDVSLQTFKDIGHDPEIHDVTYENVQARARTNILMNLANKHNAILVGTGDLSEEALGWCTYNGDHMSMYNPNCSIPKTLIRPLIRWYANTHFGDNEKIKNILLDIIDTPISPELLPTDGKKVVQKTENSVGPYEVIDFFIYYYVGKRFSKDKILFLANKAFAEKYSMESLTEYFDKFERRFFNNQFKRNCCPDGPRVGTIGLSPTNWRMPSDTNYSRR